MPRAWLIAGGHGTLGSALAAALADRGAVCEAPGAGELDITDGDRVAERVARLAAECEQRGVAGVVVNAAAYTDVEAAEDDEDAAFRVNATGPGYLARACEGHDLRFVHVSTDFVFDGSKDGAYSEDDEPRPLSVYGASKLAGERSVLEACPDALVVRTAWLFGPPQAGFPARIIEIARGRDSIRVVDDERGSPTYAPDLAEGIVALVNAGATGVVHLAGSGDCNRHELAVESLRLAGLGTRVDPVSSAEFPTRARRPANSVLDCGKAAGYGVRLRDWRESLAEFVANDTHAGAGERP